MKKLILVVPLLIIILVVTATVLFFLGIWLSAIFVFFFAFVLNWWSESFAINLFNKNNGQYDFRLLTFNINGAYNNSLNKGTTQDLITFLLKQDADIILLQEYNAELYPSIQKHLCKKYEYSSSIDKSNRFKSIFSRLPIEDCEQLVYNVNDSYYKESQAVNYCNNILSPNVVLPICKIKIRVKGKIIQLFNCHLMSNNYSVVIRNLKRDNKSLIYGIIPILQSIDFGYKVRELQVRVMSDHIDGNFPTIASGDYNDIGGSSVIRLLKKDGLQDAWWHGGFGFGFTFHGMGLRFRLDHVMYSNHFKLCRVKVPYTNVSDHSPFICDFSLNS